MVICGKTGASKRGKKCDYYVCTFRIAWENRPIGLVLGLSVHTKWNCSSWMPVSSVRRSQEDLIYETAQLAGRSHNVHCCAFSFDFACENTFTKITNKRSEFLLNSDYVNFHRKCRNSFIICFWMKQLQFKRLRFRSKLCGFFSNALVQQLPPSSFCNCNVPHSIFRLQFYVMFISSAISRW